MVYMKSFCSNCFFGILTDVDWNEMFKSFFTQVRIKIACRNPTKIPFERLIEMRKKILLLGFTVEGFEQVDSNNAIVEMDKANVTVQPAPEKSIKKTSVGSEYHVSVLSDVAHENFIMECTEKKSCHTC